MVEMSTIVTQTRLLAVATVYFSDFVRAIAPHTSLRAVHQGRLVTAAVKCSGSTSDPL